MRKVGDGRTCSIKLIESTTPLIVRELMQMRIHRLQGKRAIHYLRKIFLSAKLYILLNTKRKKENKFVYYN